jgi:hypothetical protein
VNCEERGLDSVDDHRLESETEKLSMDTFQVDRFNSPVVEY